MFWGILGIICGEKWAILVQNCSKIALNHQYPLSTVNKIIPTIPSGYEWICIPEKDLRQR